MSDYIKQMRVITRKCSSMILDEVLNAIREGVGIIIYRIVYDRTCMEPISALAT